MAQLCPDRSKISPIYIPGDRLIFFDQVGDADEKYTEPLLLFSANAFFSSQAATDPGDFKAVDAKLGHGAPERNNRRGESSEKYAV